MAKFVDTGYYYSSEEMQKKFIVLSMNSGLVYDTEDIMDVRLIKKVTDEFYAIAKADIKNDVRCFYGEATTFTNDEGKLEWGF